jgi:hypothetical protein
VSVEHRKRLNCFKNDPFPSHSVHHRFPRGFLCVTGLVYLVKTVDCSLSSKFGNVCLMLLLFIYITRKDFKKNAFDIQSVLK